MKYIQTSFTLPPRDLLFLDYLAESRQISRSEVIRTAIHMLPFVHWHDEHPHPVSTNPPRVMSSQLIEIPATKQFMQSGFENGLAEQYPDFKVRQQEYCKTVARAIVDDIKDRRSDDALPHDE